MLGFNFLHQNLLVYLEESFSAINSIIIQGNKIQKKKNVPLDKATQSTLNKMKQPVVTPHPAENSHANKMIIPDENSKLRNIIIGSKLIISSMISVFLFINSPILH